jgi:hypothetical protein
MAWRVVIVVLLVAAERVAAHFAAHVRDEVDLVPLRTELVTTVRDAVVPASVAVWLRSPGSRP